MCRSSGNSGDWPTGELLAHWQSVTSDDHHEDQDDQDDDHEDHDYDHEDQDDYHEDHDDDDEDYDYNMMIIFTMIMMSFLLLRLIPLARSDFGSSHFDPFKLFSKRVLKP